MSNEKNTNNQTVKLDDTQRVRVLSPGMLVAKRFIRNRLAIIGLIIIVCMFLFSFIGGMIIPYGESQVFYTTEEMKKDYAGATYINEYQMYEVEDMKLPSDIYSKFVLATTKNQSIIETRDGSILALRSLQEDAYILYLAEETRNPMAMNSDECKEALAEGSNYFEYQGEDFVVDESSGKKRLYAATEIAIMCELSFTPYLKETTFSYEFCQNVLIAMSNGDNTVEADGVTYAMENEGEEAAMVYSPDGTELAYVSNMNINSVGSAFLTPSFKEAVKKAIDDGLTSFTYTNETGEKDSYLLNNKEGQYVIQRYEETRVIDTYASPSAQHWVGTDANGMDLLARLMYGGRISLMIGFIVVFIEVILGVIIGGIAGYFGDWIDNLLMRFVDIIYCIPSMPLYLILGSIMDHYRASAATRIYMLCIVMSLLGWVGIARIVRGQILSLREQEFMVAAEATGISIGRRIFKHLIPNVIPQLVVFATMGLGDVILAEATLSFLGLGIKYPAASWGSIINAVNDSFVMTNYLFVWIPAGMLILLTVLAFNFIGDGLRDAFDPKMKR